MIKINLTRVVVILFLGAFFVGCGEYDYSDYDKNLNDLELIVEEHWKEFSKHKSNFPGGYALQVLHPKGDYFVSVGDLKHIDNETHFRAASTTKTFTAAGILLLHQMELLNINDPITGKSPDGSTTYLPDARDFQIPFAEEFTIKMLLQHRGGIFDVTNAAIPERVDQAYAGKNYIEFVKERDPNHTFTVSEMAGVVTKNRLFQFKPNTRFQYSNTGYALLGLIIERISGQKYEEFIQTHLLKPIELDDTSFPHEGSDQLMPHPFVESYGYYKGEIVETWKKDNVSAHVAEGNVVTTPWDLANWIYSLYTGQTALDYKYVKNLMMDCLPTFEGHQNYGLGTVFTPDMGYGHNGGHRAYFTVARYDPDTDVTLVLYVNVWDYETFEFDIYTQVYNMYDLIFAVKKLLTD